MKIYYCIFKKCVHNNGKFKCNKGNSEPQNNIVLNKDECEDFKENMKLFEVN